MTRGLRFDALDGLRAVAVLLVFCDHVDQGLFPGGWIGVDLFFALSGYLITTLLMREFTGTGGVSFRRFYARRFLRLMPALVVMVIVVFAVTKQNLRDVPVTLLYLMDVYAPLLHITGGYVGHTWSLAVEEQFYLVWPLLLVAGLRRSWRLPTVLIAAGLLCAAAAAGCLAFLSPSDVYRSPLPHVPELVAGALLAFAVARRWSVLRWLARPAVPAVVFPAMAVALFVAGQEQSWLYFGGFLLVAVALTALVGHVVLQPDGRVARVFSARPAVWLGQRSYGFYLWHYPVLYWLHQHTDRAWLIAVIGAPVSLLLTVVSWRVVEQPFLKLKQRFEPPVRADVRAPAAIP